MMGRPVAANAVVRPLAKTRVSMAALRAESVALDATGVISCPDPWAADAARRWTKPVGSKSRPDGGCPRRADSHRTLRRIARHLL
jgi:hypothetical protein